jgi:hypothetical protein
MTRALADAELLRGRIIERRDKLLLAVEGDGIDDDTTAKYDEAYKGKKQELEKLQLELRKALKDSARIHRADADLEDLKVKRELFLAARDKYADAINGNNPIDLEVHKKAYIEARREYNIKLGLGAVSLFSWKNFFILAGVVLGILSVRYYLLEKLTWRVYVLGIVCATCFSIALGIFTFRPADWFIPEKI